MQNLTLSTHIQAVQSSTNRTNLNTQAIASNDKEYVTFPVIFRWLLVLFAYSWWLIVILPFTIFDANLSLNLRLQSIPLALVALTLAVLFQTALNQLRYGLASLFALGLFIAGTLA